MTATEERFEAWVTLVEVRQAKNQKFFVYCEIHDHEALCLPKGANWFDPPNGLQLPIEPKMATIVRKGRYFNVESLHNEGLPQSMEQVEGETIPDVNGNIDPQKDDQYGCFPVENGKFEIVRLPRKLLKEQNIGRILAPFPIQFDIGYNGIEYVAKSLNLISPAAFFAEQVGSEIPVVLAVLGPWSRDGGGKGVYAEACFPGAAMSALVYLPAILLRRVCVPHIERAAVRDQWNPEDFQDIFAEQERALIAQEKPRITHLLVVLGKNTKDNLRIDRLLHPRGIASAPGSIVADWVGGAVSSPPFVNDSGKHFAEVLLATSPYEGDNVCCYLSKSQLGAAGMTVGTEVALSIKESKGQKYVWNAGRLHCTTPLRGDEEVNDQ